MNRPNINYVGQEWAQVEQWLVDEQVTTYQRLVNVKATEAETQQLRGRAMLIAQMLGFKTQPAA